MNRKVSIFLACTLLSLTVTPLINIARAPNLGEAKWTDKSFLYNLDFVSSVAAKMLYPLGISTDPGKVIVGREGWLFLGDQYEKTLSADRRAVVPEEIENFRQIKTANDSWKDYLDAKGVKLFRVLIGPNKGSIYPEHMPDWAKPAPVNATAALLAATDDRTYVDVRPALLEAKKSNAASLYFKTDTHWNALGAGLAFQAFARQIAESEPGLIWPDEAVYRMAEIVPREGGDLAKLLRLTSYLTDVRPQIDIQKLDIETTVSDFYSSKIIHEGGNRVLGSGPEPMLVHSEGALNKKKVLWLRDSFGDLLTPLMAATFSDVVHIYLHEGLRPGGRLAQLVEEWKPDYVFFTVVERNARTSIFATTPPVSFLKYTSSFNPSITSTLRLKNDLKASAPGFRFHVEGADPYLVFSLSRNVTPREFRYLNIDLDCDDGSESVPMQIWWLENDTSNISNERSVRFQLPSKTKIIDLATIPNWKNARNISGIRLDIDAPNACRDFVMKSPTLANASTP